jgi:hypothetical protein
MIGTFEEDINLESTTLAGGVISGKNLTIWREQPLPAKWETHGSQVVMLGWDAHSAAGTATYAVRVPMQGLPLSEESVLVFSMADASPGASEPVDLMVEVVDRQGAAARLPLRHFALLQPQIEGRLGKATFFSPFPASEPVLQHFEFPLADFSAANPAFNPTTLAEVRFIFDRTAAGTVALDDIGLREGE